MASSNNSATMNIAMDSADEAGGESVFSSDGLPSLAAPLPPPPLPSIGGVGVDGNDDGGDAVVEEESNPREAFEAFAESGGWTVGLSNDNDNHNAPAMGGINKTSWADPRRRLFQLKAELDQLEAQLANEKQRTSNDDDDDGDANENAVVAATMGELKSRLASLGMDGDANNESSLASMLKGRQEDLSAVISKDLTKFGKTATTTTNGSSDNGGGDDEDISKEMGSLTLRGESKEGAAADRIVYELYRNGNNNNASATSTVPREAHLEARLRALELALGSSSNNSNNNNDKSILQRLADAEKLASQTDPRSVEKLAAKAKVVRADLEAAARARSKLGASKSGTSGAAAAKDDAQKIAALHGRLMELEGTSAHLPALTLRLAELNELHSTAAGFGSRLDAAEEAARRSEGTLSGVEAALARMEGGWKENLEGVAREVGRLDGLLKGRGEGS